MPFPYTEVQVRADGSVHDRREVDTAVRAVADAGASDVLVLAHGWNSDMPGARRQYHRLMASMDAVRHRVPSAAGRTIAVVGVLWPSVKWADEDDVAGGGAGLAAADPAAALAADVRERVDDPEAAAALAALVPRLDTSPAARAEFLDLLRAQLPAAPVDDDDPPPASFVAGDAQTVFELAGTGDGLTGPEPSGGAAAFSFGGLLDGARNLLNLTTYYTMKDRAGAVGRRGVAEVLAAVHAGAGGPRLHLVGHSFGARVCVAAAAAGSPPVHGMSLLQGAFSHYGLSTDWDGRGTNGAFQRVPGRLTGPLTITHTSNDRAVGLAYAVASRLARQAASGLGDERDPYGGIGRNGALRTRGATDAKLQDVGGGYTWGAGRVVNLAADTFIANHSDVTGHQVGYAVLSAVTS